MCPRASGVNAASQSHIADVKHATVVQGAATAAFVWTMFNLERHFYGTAEGMLTASGTGTSTDTTVEDAAAAKAERAHTKAE